MIAVVDYSIGNLRSVSKALEAVGAHVVVTRDAKDLRQAERIVLPGVGAFADGMRHLRESGLVEVLHEEVLERGKPFLGICLGMQLLAGEGHELGRYQGLGWLPGSVLPLEPRVSDLKIPHVGWNDISVSPDVPLLGSLSSRNNFYFSHSYHFACEDAAIVAASCDYGSTFVAAILHRNILATQFHPEKSQENGLRLLKAFLNWNPALAEA